jgi:hypothetical protein
MPRPYQPSLLRLLHGATALLVLAAWLSGLLVYSLHDGRWGRLPFSPAGDWVDLHGTAGVLLLPLALIFAAYALTLGRRRLRRPANALALAALALAIGSGKLMNEDWLRRSELDHWVYGLHLLGWLLLSLAVVFHLAGVLQRGGWPLAGSMLSWRLRHGDQPRHWLGQLRSFGGGPEPH